MTDRRGSIITHHQVVCTEWPITVDERVVKIVEATGIKDTDFEEVIREQITIDRNTACIRTIDNEAQLSSMLLEMVMQHCLINEDSEYLLDDYNLSTNADAIEMLEKFGRVTKELRDGKIIWRVKT